MHVDFLSEPSPCWSLAWGSRAGSPVQSGIAQLLAGGSVETGSVPLLQIAIAFPSDLSEHKAKGIRAGWLQATFRFMAWSLRADGRNTVPAIVWHGLGFCRLVWERAGLRHGGVPLGRGLMVTLHFLFM